MTAAERLQAIAEALPSDRSAVTLTRADLVALLAADAPGSPTRDMTVGGVAEEVGRATSTVRTWLIDGKLRGYKLQGRDWRVTRAALAAFLDGEGRVTGHETDEDESAAPKPDSAWRRRLAAS